MAKEGEGKSRVESRESRSKKRKKAKREEKKKRITVNETALRPLTAVRRAYTIL